ncbi:MAG: DUF429 domain-containing protein [Rhodococcus sp. (in: high G+C Gram-positive bacteria)]
MPSPAQNSASVAGVDGAAGKWIVAVLDGRDVELTLAQDVDAVLDVTQNCAAVGVDMPLSIPDTGVRTAEAEVRRFLGSARSSIFATPVREAVYADSWEEACVISRAHTGKAISKQSWYLTRYIQAWQAAEPDLLRVLEVHPESSFRALAPDTVFTSKKRARGIAQRFGALEDVVDTARLIRRVAELDDGPAMDDVLDAVAAAWSARRWLTGEADVFGDSALDSRGRPDRIIV